MTYRQIREKAKLTQNQVANMFYCTQAYVSMFENGKVENPVLKAFYKSITVEPQSQVNLKLVYIISFVIGLLIGMMI